MSLVALDQSKTLAGVEHDRAVSDDRALALRRQHVSYREIARQLGLSSPSRAHAAVRRAIAAEPFDDVEAVRRDIAEQLDEALGVARSIIRRAALVGPASGPQPAANDDDRAVRALETYVRLLDRKAKLFGADLPVRRFVQVEVITDELLRAEGERLEAELTAMGVDLSAFPTPEEIAQRLLATRQAVALPERVDVGPVARGGIALPAAGPERFASEVAPPLC